MLEKVRLPAQRIAHTGPRRARCGPFPPKAPFGANDGASGSYSWLPWASSRRVQTGRPAWTGSEVLADHSKNNRRTRIRTQGQLGGISSKRIQTGEPNINSAARAI